jgi:DHA3 family macrolide efflux protein-like MFS transporter
MATQFSVEDNIPWKPRFFTIWIGQATSLLGSQLVGFALIWYLTVRTGSATVLAIASLVGMLPSVILGPFVGPLVDRWNRRRTLLVADSIIALATLALSLLFMLGDVDIWQIFLLMFIRAVAGGFHSNSMAASTSLMVPIEHLARVQGFNQMLNGGLNVIAAPLGAILYEALALQWILMLDVFSALIAIVPLFFFEIPQPDRKQSEAFSGKASTYWQDMAAGFRYVWSWKGLFMLAIIAALLNFLLAPTGALNPLLIKNHYQGTVVQLGTFNSIFGIGIILGGLLLGVWGGFKRRILTSLLGVIFLGVGILTQGLLPGNLFFVALIAVGIVGFSLPIANGSIGAIMQANVAPDMQGRVFSLIGTLSGAMAPIGLAIAGPVSDFVGIQTWFIAAGITCVVMGFVGIISPTVFNIESNNPNKREETGEETKQSGEIGGVPQPETIFSDPEK